MNTLWPPSRQFWSRDFPEATSNRTTPYLFKGIIPSSAASPRDALAGLDSLRRAHAAGTQHAARARVYVGEDRHDELIETVLAKDGWDDGQFVPWMQSLVGADRFSLVLNNLETASPQLAAGLGEFLRSLYDGWGVPIGGAEQVAFAGNYSGTAFGVHEGAEDAFLCHLGPGVKDFYCWSQEEYVRLTGSTAPLKGDYQWLLPHAELFVMEPGDALFLPKRVFHVGRQDDFSVSVAVSLYTYPDDRVLRLSVLPELLEHVLGEDPDNPMGTQSPLHAAAAGSAPAAARLTERARTALAAAGDQLEQTVAQHVEGRWMELESNGGWEKVASDLGRMEAAAAFDAAQLRPGGTVSIPAPYQLRITGPQQAYLRGVAVTCDTTPLTEAMVDALNKNTPTALPDDDAVHESLVALGTTGGIHIITGPNAPEARA
ncbi:hypothetical protein AB0G42_16035 [Streptomyces yangpuensis]|uniref:hypothetical protein n=1 Tax=Streptomyces yangpuensis TaxID=1648182 RepID=UPI003440926E